jgi:hypothetical protein
LFRRGARSRTHTVDHRRGALVPYFRSRAVRAATLFVALCCVAVACDSSNEAAGSKGAAGGGARTTPHDVGTTTRASSSNGALTIETTSARAAFVSDGNVLVTISGPAARGDVQVTRNGDNVTDGFARVDGRLQGLVDGLHDGENALLAQVGGTRAGLTVVNHPKNGPMFAGAHLEPWVCTTQDAGLGQPTDADCDAPARTSWSYKAKDGSIKPLPGPSARPADLATTSVGGNDVPFVIRTEVGVIDRGIYYIWVLDPDAGDAAAPFRPAGWNRRLVYRFGGGCGTQYSQGTPLAVALDADLLGKGYALATNTLDTFQTACNDVLSAEAAMMTREHFVESYGHPDLTIGDGGSGGAIQQLLIAYGYPGLLDGVSASVPFPDAASIAGGVTDCGLLVHYYTTPKGAALTTGQRAAINGHKSAGTCELWNRLFVGGVNPVDGCDPKIADQVYDARTNRDGARCTLQDMNIAVFGKDPNTGFARRPLDNIGIQYGLRALNDGVIGVDQFLDVNESIGGYDIDGNIVPERASMDEETAAITYRTGRITEAGPLLDVPIILRNVDTDALGDIHTRVHPFSVRERLRRGGTDDPNLLLWTSPAAGTNLSDTLLGNIGDANAPITVLDEWLTAYRDGGGTGTVAQRLAAAKPKDAVNQCVLPDGTRLTGGWELYDDPGPCRDAFPVYAEPRMAAGQALRGDIIKCALGPIDDAAYTVPFTDEQRARLERIFPDGVCDWDKPGVGQQPPTGVWQTYGS